MDISILDRPDGECDRFVREFPSAKLCHLWAWGRMVEQVSGHRSYYLVARNGAEVCGILPLTHVRSRLFGNRLISQAFSSYGGPLASSREVLESLLQQGILLARQLRCRTAEFRSEFSLPGSFYEREAKVSMRLELQRDTESLWKSFSADSKVRTHVRKGQKAGITCQCGGVELLPEFYEVYTLRMHQLGTPCYSKEIMRGILETFPEHAELAVARWKGKTIGGRLVCRFNEFLESIWGVTRIEYNTYSPNHVMYWELFQKYAPAGVKWFDFGPSTLGSGHHDFKKQWGAKEFELHYQIWTHEGQQPSILSPNNPKYRRRIELWKKLPVWLTRWVGPMISRGLP